MEVHREASKGDWRTPRQGAWRAFSRPAASNLVVRRGWHAYNPTSWRSFAGGDRHRGRLRHDELLRSLLRYVRTDLAAQLDCRTSQRKLWLRVRAGSGSLDSPKRTGSVCQCVLRRRIFGGGLSSAAIEAVSCFVPFLSPPGQVIPRPWLMPAAITGRVGKPLLKCEN